MSKRPRIVWHYTTEAMLSKIIVDRFIKPATIGVPKHERPIVWFSSNPDFEPTARKLVRLADGSLRIATFEEMEEAQGVLVRIAVECNETLYDWRSLRLAAGMDKKTAAGLEKSARRQGSNVGYFWGSLEPVPQEKWVGVEVWDRATGEWVDFLEYIKTRNQ